MGTGDFIIRGEDLVRNTNFPPDPSDSTTQRREHYAATLLLHGIPETELACMLSDLAWDAHSDALGETQQECSRKS